MMSKAAIRIWVLLGAVLAIWALFVLEAERVGLTIEDRTYAMTPVTYYGAGDGPHVVMAHGFAGSRQMMQGYALSLAHAGYQVHAFDFEGHGSHPVPMSGDVSALDGTTRKLVSQTREVIAHIGASDTPIALVGHSMATDILVRVAKEDRRTGPLVLISAFSRAVSELHPENALLIAGAWEPGLAAFAESALKMVDAEAELGTTASAGQVERRAVIAPYVEHVAILQSRAGRAETVAWLNRFYGQTSAPAIPPTGWAFVALLFAIALVAAPLAGLLPRRVKVPPPLRPRDWALVASVPALVAPAIAYFIPIQVLPVLVADYIALHLLIFGGAQIVLLAWLRRPLPKPQVLGSLLLLFWGLGAFGFALHRYGTNFWPTEARFVIIAALTLGAVPFMLADAWTTWGAPLWQRVAGRLILLLSLGLAVLLDFEDLFFLIMIAPVILLFLAIFGGMGQRFATRCGPASSGLPLGIILAWALGVSFPLFAR